MQLTSWDPRATGRGRAFADERMVLSEVPGCLLQKVLGGAGLKVQGLGGSGF